jgi:glycine amidinotransferase
MSQYLNEGFDVQFPTNLPINCVQPPSIVRIGQDLYVDVDTHSSVWGFVCEWMIDTSKKYRINICDTQGHSDGVFCPVAPGLIVSTHYKTDYTQSFPGWELFRIPSGLHNFSCPKNWMMYNPSIDNNKAFSQHILDIAASWVGNFTETVPEFNMLVIDEKNVVINSNSPNLITLLESKGITPIVCPLRHRFFWDGGWHCLTLDVRRSGGQNDYGL